MKSQIMRLLARQAFYPGLIGIFLNPFYLARRGLAEAMKEFSESLTGDLLDVGCGTKPYQQLFNVNTYTGLEIDNNHSRMLGIADYFYDGSKFPFPDQSFDAILCNQVLEHVFNPNFFLTEIHRVMKPGAKMILTIPFVWDEHEQPYDYARYTSYGLEALLNSNHLNILRHKKLGTGSIVLFQIINTYLYKISKNWNKWTRLVFVILIMGSVNLIGLLASYILPTDPDLFLDHIVLAQKP